MRTLPRRAYKKTAKGTFDDAAYFDGQYASQMAPERPQQSKEERRLPRPLSAKVPERYVWCVEETNGEKKKIERIE